MKLLLATHHRRFKAAWRTGSLARELSARGHEVTLLCTADESRASFRRYEDAGVEIIEAPDLLFGRMRSGWDPIGMIRRMSVLDGAGFDLVHSFETRPATIHPVLRLLRRRPAALVIDWCDWWGRGGLIAEQRPAWYRILLGGVETWYEEHFRPFAHATTVISRGLGTRAESLGVSSESIFWIPNGCSPRPEISDPERRANRVRFGIAADSFVLGFSALDVFIGVDLVLDAVRLAHRAHDNVRLLMTGRRDRRLQQAIDRADVGGLVHHLGHLSPDDYLRALSVVDAFLVPFPDRVANHGRWPGRVNEYLALGRPIVTQPVGEMRRLLDAHPVGLLAEGGAEGFALCIEQLVSRPEQRIEMGLTAKALAEGELSWRSVVDRLEEAYLFAVSVRAAKSERS